MGFLRGDTAKSIVHFDKLFSPCCRINRFASARILSHLYGIIPQPVNMTSVRSNFITFISSTLIFLFIYTALSKFRDFQKFIHVLGSSPLIGPYNHLVAWTIPLLELTIAVLLFLPATKRVGLYCASILLALFTVYVAYMVTFVPHLPCSCGGVIQNMGWGTHLIFNSVLTALSFWGVRLLKKEDLIHDAVKQNIVFT
jgi:hypothetical protein